MFEVKIVRIKELLSEDEMDEMGKIWIIFGLNRMAHLSYDYYLLITGLQFLLSNHLTLLLMVLSVNHMSNK